MTENEIREIVGDSAVKVSMRLGPCLRVRISVHRDKVYGGMCICPKEWGIFRRKAEVFTHDPRILS